MAATLKNRSEFGALKAVLRSFHQGLLRILLSYCDTATERRASIDKQ